MRYISAMGLALLLPALIVAQNPTNNDVFQKANNAVNKAANVIAVFQPLLLKARQVYYDARQAISKPDSPAYNSGQTNPGSYNSSGAQPSGYPASNNPTTYNPTTYLQGQNLPVNNPAAVNNDGTGNWGNQNNGLYGNCLDAMTGTVLGIGEAAQKPGSVDLLFFAPSDGQNTYYIMTPDFARNNSSAGAMSQHGTDAVAQWSDVNETEVSLTRLTVGQFQQIRTNSQITSAVMNAPGYSGYYASVGKKLDGQVFAVKAQLDNRQLYALVAVLQQMGTSGSNGYLKIMIKAQGVDNNAGQTNVNAYQR